jgi:hypothetical protein
MRFFLIYLVFKEALKTVDMDSSEPDLVISSTLPFILVAQSFANLKPSGVSLE